MSSETLQPQSIDELAAAMTAAAAHRQTVAVRGARSKADWAMPSEPADVVIDTRALRSDIDHAAGDLVVTVPAGVALADLQQQIAGARQWLALDPPEPDATIGGIVATAASGPRRLRYGTPRDLLIGITVVLADGTIAHSGGKVVKNVAGYDLGKLFTGSFGTLGVIASCTFRLHPLAPTRQVVTAVTADPAVAVRQVHATGATPTAMEWDGRELVVVIESIESAAVTQAQDIAAAIDGSVGSELPGDFGQRPWRNGGVGLKLTHRLGAINDVLTAVAARLPGARIRAHAGSGVVWVAADPTVAEAAAIRGLRSDVEHYDGQVIVVVGPADLKREVDSWGPVRGLELMRRIKDRFDPDHRLAPGTFVGGI